MFLLVIIPTPRINCQLIYSLDMSCISCQPEECILEARPAYLKGFCAGRNKKGPWRYQGPFFRHMRAIVT
ncbi:MAG: hypothetical protein ACMUIL_00335 [bacterium]